MVIFCRIEGYRDGEYPKTLRVLVSADMQYGFLLPPHQIRAAADEITTGLVHLAKFIYNVEVVN